MEKCNIAEVIVDVSSTNTDRPFSYLIPDKFQNDIQVGCRVQVPFGNRKIQGYIVQIKKDVVPQKLKALIDVMDFIPSVTEELLALGRHMADEYLCHTITSLQSMVPAVLKGKTKKIIRLHPSREEGIVDDSFVAFLRRKKEIPWEEALGMQGITVSLLRRWVEENQICVEESVRDRVTVKKTMWVWASRSEEIHSILEKIPKSAKQQQKILHFFSTHKEKIALSSLLSQVGTTRPVVKNLVEKGWLEWEELEEYRDPFYQREFTSTKPMHLTLEQESVLSEIIQPLREQRHHTFLLQGVTGSGKTEIYLQAIEDVLLSGREAIVLVPEISLTPQMVERFKGRFGTQVAVLHSRLSSGEKYDEWRKIRNQQVKVVVGARSAVFAPFENVGIIIIDEEHESSYKQEENPKYDAREIARWRAKRHNAVLVLGSATPSLDSHYLAQQGKYQHVQLTERVQGRPLPKVHVVDMRDELKKGNRSIFSQALRQALEECVDKGEQAVLFLNRRGFSTFVICRDCGEALKCSHCDISLTFHQSNHTVRCHYCGFAANVPCRCPVCQSAHIRHFGTGTQRVEHELLRTFPDMRVIRMDVDTTSRKGDHERLLSRFSDGKADILLGTQMIAKGLDFPNVTLVGAIAADAMLHLPDYRAAERTFQLLVQVSGRAGRHEKEGQVILQTYSVDHYSIQMASLYQVDAFYKEEYHVRKKHGYPPFCGLYTILLSHPDRLLLNKIGLEIIQYLKKINLSRCSILGPVPPPVSRIQDRHRLQIVIKVQNDRHDVVELQHHLRKIQRMPFDKNVRISIRREGVEEG